MPYPAPHSEVSQRIMAVLYVQKDGSVLSDTGSAIARLRALMVGEYAHNTVANAIRGLEQSNLVVRDNRYANGTRGRLVEVRPGQKITAGMKCFGVHLAVERDELPLQPEYLEELRKQIAAKMIVKSYHQDTQQRPEPPTSHRRVTKPAPAGTEPEVATVDQAVVDRDVEDLIARSLLEQVIEMVRKPAPDPETTFQVETLSTHNQQLSEQLTRLNSELAACKRRRDEAVDRASRLDETITTMRKRIDELGLENETLKRATLRRAGGDTRRLTSEIADIVGPEAREALKRLSTARPDDAPAHRSPHGNPGSRPV